MVRKRPSVKTWIGTAQQGNIAVASASKVLVASLGGFTLGVAGTVIRSRGIFVVTPQAFSADLNYDGAFGIGVVSQTALTTGITAIPGPFSDDNWPGWYVHQYYAGIVDFQDASGSRVLCKEIQYEIDSKAMRKVRSDEALVFVCESRFGAVNVKAHIRTLFMES